MQAERDKIDAERAENQRMMQELLALKAQLEQQGGEKKPLAEPTPDAAVTKETVADETAEHKAGDTTTSTEPASEATPEENVMTDEAKAASEDTAPAEATDENQ